MRAPATHSQNAHLGPCTIVFPSQESLPAGRVGGGRWNVGYGAINIQPTATMAPCSPQSGGRRQRRRVILVLFFQNGTQARFSLGYTIFVDKKEVFTAGKMPCRPRAESVLGLDSDATDAPDPSRGANQAGPTGGLSSMTPTPSPCSTPRVCFPQGSSRTSSGCACRMAPCLGGHCRSL